MKLLIASFIAAIISLSMPEKNNHEISMSDNMGSKPLFSFGIIADAQYCDCPTATTRAFRSSPVKLKEALGKFVDDSVSFVVNLGDLIEGEFRSFKPVMDIIDASGLKTYHIAGNHDYAVESRLKKRLPVLTSKEGYYAVDRETFRLIFLNGNELSTYISGSKSSIKSGANYLEKLKSEGEINALEWNGGLGKNQLCWMKQQLDDASVKKQKVLIFCHFPVYPENNHNLLNYKEVLALLENYHNIVAWFSGHNHSGNYGNFNLIHFVTFKGMVETETLNSFAIVEVYNNKIWIKGFGREKSQILAY